MLDFIKNKIRIKQFIEKNKRNGCYIDKTIILRQPEYIVVGENTSIGPNSKLLCWDLYSSNGNNQRLTPHLSIGSNVHITRNITIQCAGETIIEDNALLASDIFIIDFNHGTDATTLNYLDNELLVKKVHIKKGCWIGNNSIILPGVTIGEKSIIGAGSVVTKDIPDYTIAAGNPARVIKRWNLKQRVWDNAREFDR